MVDLDEKQAEIVCYNHNDPLSVEAGPGAGKTRVIIERVKFLVNEVKIKPESLLVITFTRKAADELKERLAESDIAKSDIDLMQISTIHGFCSKVLEDRGAIGFDVVNDDLNEKNNMFVSKHLKELGFKDEFTIKSREVRDIIRKYNEYTIFKVDTKRLVQYIKETRPISQDYLDLVKSYSQNHDGEFPFDEIRDDDVLKKSYYNAKYLKIAESYPEYLKLLDQENKTDFSLMQVKTLEFLEKDPVTQFKNVLIDEFQDTDPVQMKIFEILMDHADSFTVVGDVDQSIYGFRGSIENYFDKLYDIRSENLEQKDLSTNYRSSNQIIDFSEDFIINQRSKHTAKNDVIGARNIDRNVYYMVSDNAQNEAKQIVEILLNLKANGKIDDYSDVGILLRSVKSNSNCTDDLISELNKEDIPYQVKGRSDLIEKPEIKSILTLIYHVINGNENKHIFNSWERDWLNIKAFTGVNFPQVLVDLSSQTIEILNNVQNNFEEEILQVEKEVHKEFTGKSSRIKKFKGVFNRDKEELVEIFRRVQKPILSNENLIKWGVRNSDDLSFFYLLNSIRDEYLDEDIEWKDRPTILDLYLKLLTITDYLNEDFINNIDNKHHVENLAILSNTFFNYEQVRNPKNLSGAFWFLYHNIDEYGAYASDDVGVQIMTVHKAKGLQFPIVIVASLEEGKFPMSFKNPNLESGYAFISGKMRPIYYTPNDCLEYKPFESIDEEIMAHEREEERIIYVAITRAQDTLILSTISQGSEEHLDYVLKYVGNPKMDVKSLKEQFISVQKGSEKIQNCIDENIDYCKALISGDDVERIVCEKPKKEGELIKLSFTGIENYQKCPLKYKLSNLFGFKTSETKFVSDGIFIHKAFEIINKRIKENNNVYIGDEKLINEVHNLFSRTQMEEDEDHSKKLARITENILYYYKNDGKDLEIIDSEVPFYIKKENYSLNGVIDLIYKTKDGKIGILDYKNTKSIYKFYKKYTKQLHTYVIGLGDDKHKYNDLYIDELKIYAIKSKESKNIPINPVLLGEIEDNIDKISSNIKKEIFSSKKSKHCDECQFSAICKDKPIRMSTHI